MKTTTVTKINTMFDLSSAVTKVKNATGMKKLETNDPTIEFVTEPELYGAIPEPIPANRALPDWYKNLAQYVSNEEGEVTTNTKTEIKASSVKRCAPFMEAMTMGWIIPLAAEVHIKGVAGDDNIVHYNWNFNKELISSHNIAQVGGDEFPLSDWPVLKFHNYWNIKISDGYSALITSPMNRPGQPFTPFSGVVDVDNYFNEINAPFMWTGGEFEGFLKEGTPIVQVIPFKRESLVSDGTVRSMTDDEVLEKKRTKNELNSSPSMYRNRRWQHKRGTRIVPHDTNDSEDSGSSCPFHR